jgi:predicted Zn-dependent protease
MSSSLHPLAAADTLIERALEACRSSECVVIVEDTSEAELRFANNTVTTNGTRRGRDISVIAFHETDDGIAVGTATASGAGDVLELVRRAEADAEAAPPADAATALVTPAMTSSPSEFCDPAVLTSFAELSELVGQLRVAFDQANATATKLAGFAEQSISTLYMGSSTGLRLRHVEPTGKLEVVARRDGGARSAWAGTGAAELASIDFGELKARLDRRLEWSKRRLDLDAGRYEVVLPPDAVADLTILIWGATSGREAQEGRSVFSGRAGTTRLGEALSAHPFSLRSNPFEKGLETRPFLVTAASGQDVSVFDNGLGLEPTEWISKGRLAHLQYHRAAASQAGVLPAVSADNLVLEVPGATSTIDDLVAHTERGLLLTCLWYIRDVDPATLLVTGLTRDGVYLVEHGEIVGAVNNFRFNESPIDVLAKTIEVGRSERALSREWNEWLARTAMPSLRVAEFNMSSVSPAT